MSIKFEASGDFSQLLAENQKYQQSLVKLTEQVQKLEANANKMAAAATKAGQQFAASGTPLGDYQRTVDKLSKQMSAGAISQAEFATAVSAADAAYEKSKNTLDDASTKVDTHKTAVSGLGSQITSLAAGYVSWSAGLQLAGQALQFVQAETNKAKASQDSLVDTRRALVQVAKDETDLSQMVARADAAATKYGVDRQTAQQVLFTARSEGFEDQYESVMQAAPVVAPEKAAVVAGQVPALFKNTEKLSSEQAISGTLLAAQQSRLNFEELARSMPSAAEGGAIAGAGFGETAGVMSVLASRFKSGDTAADRIKGFGTKLGISEEFGGKGIVGGFEALQAADEETRKKFLGDSNELNSVFQILSEELPTVKARIAEINAEVQSVGAGGPSLVDRQTAVAMSDPAEQARMKRVRSEIRREIANERQFATSGSGTQAAIDDEMARLKTENVAGTTQFFAETAGKKVQELGGGENLSRAATAGTASAFQNMPVETIGATAGPLAPVLSLLQGIYRGATSSGNSDAQLEEQKTTRAAIERQTQVAEQTLEVLRRAPRSGASAAAAAPNVQRQGR